MTKSIRSMGRVVLGTTAFGVAALIDPAALAQQAASGQAELGEIVVTALRRSESLQQTPASVTALGELTLERAGVQRPADLIGLTPGVSLVHTAEIGDTQVNIRGINGARDAENSFAFIVDGIQLANPASFNREFVDLQQIEVLKGPQGALYGRNAAAGAIVVTTQAPTDELSGLAQFSYGSANTVVGEGSVSGPIIDHVLAGRFNFAYRGTDGFFRNSYLNERAVDDFSSYDFNGRLLWTPTDDWKFDIKGRYGHAEGAAIAFNAAFELPLFAEFLNQPLFYEDVNTHNFQYVNNIRPTNEQNSIEASVKADHDLSFAHLTSWVSFQEIRNQFLTDGTSGAFGFYNRPDPATGVNYCANSLSALVSSGFQFPPPQSQFVLGPYTASTCDGYQYQRRNERDVSLEIRLSSPADQALRWSGGIYFLDIDREVVVAQGEDTGQPIAEQPYLPIGTTAPTAQLYADNFTTQVYAAFGSVSYDFTPDLEGVVAMRYDVEDRHDHNLVPTGDLQPFINPSNQPARALYPLNPGLVASPGGIADHSKTFDQPEPKVTLRWSPDDQISTYLSWGIGFKSGGFNSAGSSATVALIAAATGSNVRIPDQFDKETTNAFEGGFKAKFLNGALRIEGAGFYNRIENLQFFEFFTGPEGLLRVVSNIDRVDIVGFEIGTQLKLGKYVSLDGGYSLNNSEILANSSRPNTVGNKSPYTPDYTASLGAEGRLPITETIEGFVRADVNFVGPTWFHTVQNQTVPTLFGVPGDFSKTQRAAYHTLNLRVGIDSGDYSLALYGKNLTDEHYLEEVIPAPEFGGVFIHNSARTEVGVQASARF